MIDRGWMFPMATLSGELYVGVIGMRKAEGRIAVMFKGDGFNGEYDVGAEAKGDDMLMRLVRSSMLRMAEPIPPSFD